MLLPSFLDSLIPSFLPSSFPSFPPFILFLPSLFSHQEGFAFLELKAGAGTFPVPPIHLQTTRVIPEVSPEDGQQDRISPRWGKLPWDGIQDSKELKEMKKSREKKHRAAQGWDNFQFWLCLVLDSAWIRTLSCWDGAGSVLSLGRWIRTCFVPWNRTWIRLLRVLRVGFISLQRHRVMQMKIY